MSKITKKLESVEIGKVFEIGGVEFIKFPGGANGQTIAVAKEIVFKSIFGKSNNFAESDILKKLNEDFLPGIVKAAGEDNVCEFETDLITLDGLKNYGTMKSRVSLPTVDFYRENVGIFDKYNPECWWWLATPFSAEPHYKNRYWVEGVSPSGNFGDDYCRGNNGVRPLLIFVSNISVSCEE